MSEPGSASVQLALGEWEADAVLLPPVASVTFYAGSPPVGFLRDRMADLLRQNPWLAGRLVRKGVHGGAVVLRHPREVAVDLERHFTVVTSDQVRLTTDMGYQSLVDVIGPLQVASSKQGMDADEVLFKVAVVSVEAGRASADAPLAPGRCRCPRSRSSSR